VIVVFCFYLDDKKKMVPFDVKASDENVLTVNFIHPLDETLGSSKSFDIVIFKNCICTILVVNWPPVLD